MILFEIIVDARKHRDRVFRIDFSQYGLGGIVQRDHDKVLNAEGQQGVGPVVSKS